MTFLFQADVLLPAHPRDPLRHVPAVDPSAAETPQGRGGEEERRDVRPGRHQRRQRRQEGALVRRSSLSFQLLKLSSLIAPTHWHNRPQCVLRISHSVTYRSSCLWPSQDRDGRPLGSFRYASNVENRFPIPQAAGIRCRLPSSPEYSFGHVHRETMPLQSGPGHGPVHMLLVPFCLLSMLLYL